MKPVLEIESTLTDRYQTTVPETIRRALSLSKRDKLHYKIMADGSVVLSRAQAMQHEDQALHGFLTLLENNIKHRPDELRPLTAAQRDIARALVGDAAVDLDAPLNPADE